MNQASLCMGCDSFALSLACVPQPGTFMVSAEAHRPPRSAGQAYGLAELRRAEQPDNLELNLQTPHVSCTLFNDSTGVVRGPARGTLAHPGCAFSIAGCVCSPCSVDAAPVFSFTTSLRCKVPGSKHIPG